MNAIRWLMGTRSNGATRNAAQAIEARNHAARALDLRLSCFARSDAAAVTPRGSVQSDVRIFAPGRPDAPTANGRPDEAAVA